jgi:hypothetical protein
MVSDSLLNDIYRELMTLASSDSHYPYVYKMPPSASEPEVEEKHNKIKHLRLTESCYTDNHFELQVISAIAHYWIAA